MFTYPLLRGTDHNIFKTAGETILSESTAKRLFNSIDVVGKVIKMPAGDTFKLFQVVGIAADSPPNTHLKFDMVFSYTSMYAEPIINVEIVDNWDGNNTLTYLLLEANANYESFTESLETFNMRLKDENKLQNDRLAAQKISDIHLYSHKTFETEANGDAKTVFFLLGVAFLVIISAFVNYLNLATSKALDRAKEVGLRKVVGSTQTQLKTQFLMEAFLINLFAAGLAILFILGVKVAFINIAGLPENFSIFSDPIF
jgi:putative ABC transport system permease protein